MFRFRNVPRERKRELRRLYRETDKVYDAETEQDLYIQVGYVAGLAEGKRQDGLITRHQYETVLDMVESVAEEHREAIKFTILQQEREREERETEEERPTVVNFMEI